MKQERVPVPHSLHDACIWLEVHTTEHDNADKTKPTTHIKTKRHLLSNRNPLIWKGCVSGLGKVGYTFLNTSANHQRQRPKPSLGKAKAAVIVVKIVYVAKADDEIDCPSNVFLSGSR